MFQSLLNQLSTLTFIKALLTCGDSEKRHAQVLRGTRNRCPACTQPPQPTKTTRVSSKLPSTVNAICTTSKLDVTQSLTAIFIRQSCAHPHQYPRYKSAHQVVSSQNIKKIKTKRLMKHIVLELRARVKWGLQPHRNPHPLHPSKWYSS